MIITCPNCNISGNGPDDKNGKKVTCGKCGTVFTVGEDLFKEVEVTIQPVEPVKDVLNKPIVHSKQKMNLMITVIVIITIIIMMVFKWDMNMNMLYFWIYELTMLCIFILSSILAVIFTNNLTITSMFLYSMLAMLIPLGLIFVSVIIKFLILMIH